MPARNIRKRGNSYQVRVGGLSRTEPTLALARKALVDLDVELRARQQAEAAPITLGEAIEGTLRRIRATGALREKRSSTTNARRSFGSRFGAPVSQTYGET